MTILHFYFNFQNRTLFAIRRLCPAPARRLRNACAIAQAGKPVPGRPDHQVEPGLRTAFHKGPREKPLYAAKGQRLISAAPEEARPDEAAEQESVVGLNSSD